MNKRGFVGLWADVFKGMVYGFIIGIALMLLHMYNVFHIPFLTTCGG